MDTKATPRPWKVEYIRGLLQTVGFWRISSKENICIAEIDQSLDGTSKEERHANAALIVEAVNSYDRLKRVEEKARQLAQQVNVLDAKPGEKFKEK